MMDLETKKRDDRPGRGSDRVVSSYMSSGKHAPLDRLITHYLS